MNRTKRTVSWLMLAALLLQLFTPLWPATVYAAPPGAGSGVVRIAQSDGSPIQALLIFDNDTAYAQSYRTLLEEGGVSVVLRQLGDETITPSVPDLFIPAVGNGQAGPSQASIAQDGELTTFDVILIADDLEKDGELAMDAALRQAILDSGRPVVGMGRGGARFLQEASVAPGSGFGSKPGASQVNRCDLGASLPLFQGETALPLDQDRYTLYSAAQPTAFADLAEQQPLLRRLACAEDSATEVSILLMQSRFALWGFGGAPTQMTETGRDLYTNLLWLLAGDTIEIPLATGPIRPTPGVEQDLLDALETGEAQYALAQFYDLPAPEERQLLAEAGINLLDYLSNNTYSANIQPNANFGDPRVDELLRFAGIYRPEYKLAPVLEGEMANLFEVVLIVFFADADPQQILDELLLPAFGEQVSQGATPTEWYVPNDLAKLQALTESKLVRFITPVVPPDELNENARPVVQSDDSHDVTIAGGSASYLGVSGNGVTLGIFEGRPLTDHGDMDGRIIVGAHASGGTSSHATHVSGIIMGNGAISLAQGLTDFQRRGHAPRARLVTQASGVSPGSGSGFPDRFADSVMNHGVFAHNHSYVQSYGEYDGTAVAVDQIVRGEAVSGGQTIPPNLAIFAAGNNGTGAQYGNIVGFYSVFTTAKNSLSVGSTDANTGVKSNFSSKGPTYDGRIKPDVVAPGCRNSAPSPSTGIMAADTANSNTYGGKCGTSMAAPVVTGITGLMLEQYRNSFGTGFSPLPSSIKAILVNSAVDQTGTSIYNDPDCNCTYNFGAGPDWATGYGLVNAPAAVAAVRARNIIEDQISPANLVDTYEIQVTAGRPELRFTLAWDDEAADPSSATTARKLVNDLDLVLIDPNGGLHFPWVLDPLPVTDDPTDDGDDPITQADINNNPAFRDVNDRDNVEQVLVNNPMAGTWQVRVSASALPNANPQRYSLAGDFRQLRVVWPTTSNIADAGDPVNPNVILVRLEAEQPYATPTKSAFSDATAADFQVQIDGTAADVLNGLAVGDQFWLNVRPASGIYSAGSKYDLTVNWTGYGQDNKTRAVIFTEREVTDKAIVVDYSGSMSSYDKMQAAQNAARLFIDQSLPGDRVSVVGFSTNVITPYALTEVSNDPLTPELNAAKNAVDTLTPENLTAIGPGLIEGYNQVTTPPANHSLIDVIVLLSDGMENVDPKYNTPAVKGLIQPTDTIVHTVGVGPANAGFFSLLQDIAADNDGLFFSVTETTPGAGGASVAAADATNAANTIGIDAQPVHLPNRLGEAYKNIAEDTLYENRLFQARGIADPKERPVEQWRFEVPEGSTRFNVSLNWSDENEHIHLRLRAPDAQTYYEFDKDNTEPVCRTDKTHEVCIIDNPQPGMWLVEASFETAGNLHEYAMWASAQTPVQFNLHIATPPEQRLPGHPIHLIGFVHQGGKPLAGPNQTVQVKVFDPYGTDLLGEVVLADDGKSSDGEAMDGIYAGSFIAPAEAGPYNVRGIAKGQNHEGQSFELLANTGFQLRPRVLYVHDKDTDTAQQYRELIQANGLAVDLVHKADLPAPQAIGSQYGLVIIGPDTSEWSDVEARPIIGSERRVLGLGLGGQSFFKFLQLPGGGASQGHTIQIGDYGDTIWDVDYEFAIMDRKLIQLYEQASLRVDIPVRDDRNSNIFGLNDGNPELANLLMFNSYWTLWGFQDGPKAMTQDGRDLFINTVLRAMR